MIGMKRLVLPILAVLLVTTASAAKTRPPALGLYVHAGEARPALAKDEVKAREKVLLTKWDEAAKGLKALEKDLKVKYGKKKEKWPEDQQAAYARAEIAVAAAGAAYTFVEPDLKFADTVEDIRKVLPKNTKTLHDAASPSDAHFAAEVLARHRVGVITGSPHHVLLQVSLGGKVDAKRRRDPQWGQAEWRSRMDSACSVVHAF